MLTEASPNLLLLLPIFIPLRHDLASSLPTSCGSFCHKVHYCVPAQVCSMSIHHFLFTGFSCSRLKFFYLYEAVDTVDFSLLEFSTPSIPAASLCFFFPDSFSGIFLCSPLNVIFLSYVHSLPLTLTSEA